MKTIATYTHPPLSPSRQEPDTKPGPYYVSVVDGPQWNVLAGPFRTHAEALAMVDTVRTLAQELDRKAVFYGFGTVRMKGPKPYKKPGLLNERLGLEIDKKGWIKP